MFISARLKYRIEILYQLLQKIFKEVLKMWKIILEEEVDFFS